MIAGPWRAIKTEPAPWLTAGQHTPRVLLDLEYAEERRPDADGQQPVCEAKRSRIEQGLHKGRVGEGKLQHDDRAKADQHRPCAQHTLIRQ